MSSQFVYDASRANSYHQRPDQKKIFRAFPQNGVLGLEWCGKSTLHAQTLWRTDKEIGAHHNRGSKLLFYQEPDPQQNRAQLNTAVGEENAPTRLG